jgi:hypothetical protein
MIIASPTRLVGGRADDFRAIVRVIDIHCSSLFPAAANGPDAPLLHFGWS